MTQKINKGFFAYLRPKYLKALNRLKKGLESRRIAAYSQQKKVQIWNRLSRYARHLGIVHKPQLITACLAAGFSFSNTAEAQPFMEKTGIDNPLSIVGSLAAVSMPAFVDIDGDGDKDAFIGASDIDSTNTLKYYENIGTITNPIFIERAGAANPFTNVISPNGTGFPSFADIDADGDNDVFVWQGDSPIRYFRNTGTPSTPLFSEQIGASNPLNGLNTYGQLIPNFADMDADGDLDAIFGEYNVGVKYYKNTGNPNMPIFTLQTGANDPFVGLLDTAFNLATVVDLEGDGDMDLVVAEYYGEFRYFRNTGTAAANFVEQTSGANPFGFLIGTGYISLPAFTDIDGDGDQDLFTGEYYSTIRYFRNDRLSVGIEEGIEEIQFSTYPNPVTNSLKIEIEPKGIISDKLCLYNALGQKVFEKEVKAKNESIYEEIDMRSLPAGVYSLSFGKYMRKVVKE